MKKYYDLFNFYLIRHNFINFIIQLACIIAVRLILFPDAMVQCEGSFMGNMILVDEVKDTIHIYIPPLPCHAEISELINLKNLELESLLEAFSNFLQGKLTYMSIDQVIDCVNSFITINTSLVPNTDVFRMLTFLITYLECYRNNYTIDETLSFIETLNPITFSEIVYNLKREYNFTNDLTAVHCGIRHLLTMKKQVNNLLIELAAAFSQSNKDNYYKFVEALPQFNDINPLFKYHRATIGFIEEYSKSYDFCRLDRLTEGYNMMHSVAKLYFYLKCYNYHLDHNTAKSIIMSDKFDNYCLHHLASFDEMNLKKLDNYLDNMIMSFIKR